MPTDPFVHHTLRHWGLCPSKRDPTASALILWTIDHNCGTRHTLMRHLGVLGSAGIYVR